jgi:alkylation response protein AidB-like acyl-CoA dehydrogenase
MLDPIYPLPDAVALVLRRGVESLDRGMRGPDEELLAFRNFGLLSAPLPVAYGGQNWGLSPPTASPLFKLLMAIGGISLPMARLFEGHVNAVRLIHANGTDDQKSHVFGKVRHGALLGVWGADGSNPVKLSAEGGLSGQKILASGIGYVSLAIVTTTDEAEKHQMVLVDSSDPARQSPEDWDVSAMVGSVSGGFDCSAITITSSERLGKTGAMFQEPDFHGGLWRLCACYAGAMQAIVDALINKHKLSRGFQDSLNCHRIGQAIICARSAANWSEAACMAAEGSGSSSTDAAVAHVLFAREAIEREAVHLFDIAERMGGTAIHFRAHTTGRMIRDLRLYLRQAGLDNKLSYAVELWLKNDLPD